MAGMRTVIRADPYVDRLISELVARLAYAEIVIE